MCRAELTPAGKASGNIFRRSNASSYEWPSDSASQEDRRRCPDLAGHACLSSLPIGRLKGMAAVQLIDTNALEQQPVPQLFKGACQTWPARQAWAGTAGLDYLRRQCGDAQVQVLCSSSGDFAGDMQRRQTTGCSFAHFLSSLTAGAEPSNSGELPQQLYLAQAPMAVGQGGVAPLARLMSDVALPNSLTASGRLTSVNLWMASSRGSATSLHYDQSHGLLCVLAGSKRVVILAPGAGRHLQPLPLWGESANHSRLSAASLAESTVAGARRWELVANAGDVVFIPEGHWHQISSEPGTVAVNCWWDSALSRQLLAGPSAPYYLRTALRAAVAERAEAELEGIVEHPDYALADAGGVPFAVRVNQLVQQCLLAHEGSRPDAWEVARQAMLPREICAACLLAGPLFAQPQQEPGYAALLRGLTPASMAGVLAFVADQAPAAAAAMLQSMCPTATKLYASRCEELQEDEEAMTDFYQQLYSTVPDLDALERRMLQQQEAFQRSAAELLARELLQLD